MAGADNVIANMHAWERRIMAALRALGHNYAAQMEGYAKPNASWKDDTTHARQGLFGDVREYGDALKIRISHTEEYGVYLELCNSGKYAILEPTVKKFAPDFFQDVEKVAKGK